MKIFKNRSYIHTTYCKICSEVIGSVIYPLFVQRKQIMPMDMNMHQYACSIEQNIDYKYFMEFWRRTLRLSTYLALKKLVDDTVYFLWNSEHSLFLLRNDYTERTWTNRVILQTLFCRMSGIVPGVESSLYKTIYIYPYPTHFAYTVSSTEDNSQVMRGHIPYEKIGGFEFTVPVTQKQIDQLSRQLLYLIEKNNHIKPQYSSREQKKTLLAYQNFHKNVYLKLSPSERNQLDNWPITLGNQTVRFKDVYDDAIRHLKTPSDVIGADIVQAGKWFMAMLLHIAPDVDFSKSIERDYADFLRNFRRYTYYNPVFDDAEIEAQTLFISIMTRSFKAGSTYQGKFGDCVNKMPVPIANKIFEKFLKRLEDLKDVDGPVFFWDIYVESVRKFIQPKYEVLPEQILTAENHMYFGDVQQWFCDIMDRSLFKSLQIREPDWIGKLCADVDGGDVYWSESAASSYINLSSVMMLQAAPTLLFKLKINIEFILFLKGLNKIDCIEFLIEIKDKDVRKEVLRSFLASKGKSAGDDSLVKSCLAFFKSELAEKALLDVANPVLFKPIASGKSVQKKDNDGFQTNTANPMLFKPIKITSIDEVLNRLVATRNSSSKHTSATGSVSGDETYSNFI